MLTFSAAMSPVYVIHVIPPRDGLNEQYSVVQVLITLTTLHNYRSALDNTVSQVHRRRCRRYSHLLTQTSDASCLALCGSRESHAESNLSFPLD